MIRDGSPYREQGSRLLRSDHPEKTRNRLTAHLEQLGFLVQLEPKNLPVNQPEH